MKILGYNKRKLKTFNLSKSVESRESSAFAFVYTPEV